MSSRPRACLLVAVAVVAVGAGALTAAAQGDADEAVAGRLNEAGKPVAGVTLAAARDGDTLGSTTTAEDGTWSIPLPGPGTYVVTIDVESLPEGVTLRDADRTSVEVTVAEGQTRGVLFPLGTGRRGGQQTLARVADLTVKGIRTGAIVALASIGLSLIFGVTGLVNFAHGELVTFGAVVAWYLNASAGGPHLYIAVAAAVAVVAGGLLGGVLETGLWRQLRRRRSGNVSLLVISIGLSLFGRHVILVVFGNRPLPYADHAVQVAVRWGPVSLPPKDIVIFFLSVAVLAAVGLFLRRTKLGTAMRAVSDNRDLAAASGIDVEGVIVATWVGGAGVAALGGVFLGVTEAVAWDMGFVLLLTMFAAVILGGLGSAYGAMVGGFVIGVVSEVSTVWVSTEFKVVIALAVLIGVLLVRPQGILGQRARIG